MTDVESSSHVVDTASAIADLDERGYSIVPSLIPRETALAAADYLLGVPLLPDRSDYGGVFTSLDPSRWPPFLQMAAHPVALEIAAHVIGPEFKMIGDVGKLASAPGQKAQGLHIDLPLGGWFVTNDRPFPESCPCLQTIWALTDFTAGNGATELVPFSHHTRRGPRPGVDYTPFLRPLVMEAGSLAMFHCGIWHQRARNHSDAHRVGISIPYISQWLDPVTTGWNILPRKIWRQLPESIRKLHAHVRTNDGANLPSSPAECS